MSLARARGPGEPNRACDLVAAAIVEEYLRRDPAARLNVQVTGGQGSLFVIGEVLSTADFDVTAVVRRALGLCGVTAELEPFIALEPMAPAWAPPIGSRETCTVFGYATAATPERLPSSVVMASQLAQELERRRTDDADWFWLGSDYTVTAEERAGQPLIVVRAQHLESVAAVEARAKLQTLLAPLAPAAEIRVNPAGEETVSGLGHRGGASGRVSSADQYGSALPANPSGAGREWRHPHNLGAWLARGAATDLLDQGLGQAIMVQLTWLPLEAKPQTVRARNERGQDLSRYLPLDRLDLSVLPEEYPRSRMWSL